MSMNIGEVSKRAGLTAKTVRYYAEINLVKPSLRSDTGYRKYDTNALHKLIFIRRSRAFGFSITECRELLSLYEDKSRSSADVKRLAQHRLDEIREKQRELQKLHDELAHLVDKCRGDNRPDCPIIDFLS